ncbi:hypothetical protein ACFYYR_02935 [Streptomyces sp. NPDC001922]|uniref:hypothetical protein n=1 Tax=Streptomyces sp. NPDC001922 TaxID=3364624 RepID=UPI0036A8CEE2
MSRTHRRGPSRGTKAGVAAVAAGAVAGGTRAPAGTAQATTAGAAYSRTSDWDAGRTAPYVITDDADTALRDWTLESTCRQGRSSARVEDGFPGGGRRLLPAGGAAPGAVGARGAPQ